MDQRTGSVEPGQLLVVLNVGECEPLKAVVHGVLMATAAVCAVYNVAAFLRRRERHLAINSVVYTCAAAWEHQHVQQHLACRPVRETGEGSLRDVA